MTTIATPRRAGVATRRVSVADILRFYRERPGTSKPRFGKVLRLDQWSVTNTPTGIGDCVMLTDLPRAAAAAGGVGTVWSPSPHFRTLARFNPLLTDRQLPFWISLSQAQAEFDLGPGHNFQRLRRLFGLPIQHRPAGCIIVPQGGRRSRMRVSLHFEAGAHSADQKRLYHPRAREVYPENLDIIRRFIRHHPEIDFFEVGGRLLEHDVPNMAGADLGSVINQMAACDLHIGIISGPYHIANALGVRTICIINFPAPWELMLPVVKNIDVVEAEWLYPQSHILHQDHDSNHWPRFSEATLEAAFYRETYPYENPDRYLELVRS